MLVVVNGRRMEVSDKLRDLTETKVSRLERMFDMESAEVLYTRPNRQGANSEVCEITLSGHGHHVRTKVSAVDAYTAIDKAIAKIEPQLKKLKDRQKRLTRAATPTPRTAPDVAPDLVEALEPEPAAEPRIVKSKRFGLMPMTPEEASHRMDLLGHGFFFFTNIDTHRAAVVYRRDDGDIGLIDEAD